MLHETGTEQPQVWVSAGHGYQLGLDGTRLVCRDEQGNRHEPIPARALASRVYPAWVLINDPECADAALAVLDRLTRAARQRPYDAAGTYAAVAERLPARHLPVFWEHAGRALLAAGDGKRAATAFGRAREAEAEHRLPIDDAAWLAAYREFAAAGAVSGKAVTAYVNRLRAHVEPATALAELTEFAVSRAEGGQPPWPELPRQVVAAARRADRNPAAEQRGLVGRLLRLPATREAPMALWSAWRPTLVELAAASGEARNALLELFPLADDIDGWWLDLLVETEALTTYTAEGGNRPPGEAARWLGELMRYVTRHRRDRYYRPVVPQFGQVVARLATRLGTDGTPVRPGGNVRMLQACLANGVPVVDPTPGTHLDLTHWMHDRAPDEDIPALAADARFAPLLDESMRRYRDRGDLERVPTLRDRLTGTTGPGSAASAPPPRHPLDDAKVVYALYGLAYTPDLNNVSGMLHGIRLAGGLLTGALDAAGLAEGTWLPATNTWLPLIGRIDTVALRAVAASTRDERRERLLALLEVWAETPFAEPDGRLWIGHAEAKTHTPLAVLRTEAGVAVVPGTYRGVRPFVAIGAEPGTKPPVPEGTVELTAAPSGWGGADRIRRLVALVRQRGPVPWAPEAVALLATRTGLSRPACALVLAGITGANTYHPPLLDPTERKILRVSQAEGGVALGELNRLTQEQRRDLLAEALPEDPAELWEPAGMRTVAQRVAQRWGELFGRRVHVPDETLTLAAGLNVDRSIVIDVCTALADPSAAAALHTDLNTWLERAQWRDNALARVTGADYEAMRAFTSLLRGIALGVRWAYGALPAGDPVRAGVPAAVALLRARLAHPGLLLVAGSPPYKRDIEQARAWFGDAPYSGPEPLGITSVDDGLSVMVPKGEGVESGLFFRPALVGADARTATLREACWLPDLFGAVDWLLGADCDAMVARIGSGALPDGTYEANPLLSAPDLVTEVGARLNLAPDSAALYLQLLTLPNPTDRNVRRWNAWSTTRHRTAVSPLTERGLVVEATRPRAGRRVFLPGGWAKWDKPNLPIETWKAKLYGFRIGSDAIRPGGWPNYGEFWPGRPLAGLYASAWQRVLDGDTPH